MPSLSIIAPHKPNRYHFRDVVKEMKTKGRPVIRAFRSSHTQAWVAMEGSHRLAAAYRLGLVPIIRDISNYTRRLRHDIYPWLLWRGSHQLSAPANVIRKAMDSRKRFGDPETPTYTFTGKPRPNARLY